MGAHGVSGSEVAARKDLSWVVDSRLWTRVDEVDLNAEEWICPSAKRQSKKKNVSRLRSLPPDSPQLQDTAKASQNIDKREASKSAVSLSGEKEMTRNGINAAVVAAINDASSGEAADMACVDKKDSNGNDDIETVDTPEGKCGSQDDGCVSACGKDSSNAGCLIAANTERNTTSEDLASADKTESRRGRPWRLRL